MTNWNFIVKLLCAVVAIHIPIIIYQATKVDIGDIDYGSVGIWTLTDVSDRGNTGLFSGPMIIENNRLVSPFSRPGAVIIVGVDRFTPSGQRQRFSYADILLCTLKHGVILAPPGTEIVVEQEQTVLGYRLLPGVFRVPGNSKIGR